MGGCQSHLLGVEAGLDRAQLDVVEQVRVAESDEGGPFFGEQCVPQFPVLLASRPATLPSGPSDSSTASSLGSVRSASRSS